MTEQASKMHEMRQAHRAKVAAIHADKDLTPEAKERKIRELSKEHNKAMRELEESQTARIQADIDAAYRKVHGPASRPLSAMEETAKELRLVRIRAEVTDELEAGRDDPLRAYERAVRAGDKERAEVIGKVGLHYLDDPSRRQRLRELVAENEPEDRKQARRRLQELESKQRSTELAHALGRKVRERGQGGLLGAELVQNATKGEG